jgi:zinc transport system permease protein
MGMTVELPGSTPELEETLHRDRESLVRDALLWQRWVRYAGLLAVVILAVTMWLGPALFTVSNDDEFARASGLPVMTLNLLLAVLTACTVVISMRVVGVLLVSALMVVPVATAQLITASFRTTYVLGLVIGFMVSLGGVVLSYYIDTPSGGTIVLLAIGLFAITIAVPRFGRGARRAVRA